MNSSSRAQVVVVHKGGQPAKLTTKQVQIRMIIRIAIITEAWPGSPDWLLNNIFEAWNQLDDPLYFVSSKGMKN